MQLKHRVALDDVQLDSVDDRIMISKIETGDGKENIQLASLWGEVAGSRVTSMHRDSTPFCFPPSSAFWRDNSLLRLARDSSSWC